MVRCSNRYITFKELLELDKILVTGSHDDSRGVKWKNSSFSKAEIMVSVFTAMTHTCENKEENCDNSPSHVSVANSGPVCF